MNTFVAKSSVDKYFYCFKYSKIWSKKQANIELAGVFRAKVEGRSSKNFLGTLPLTPAICHVYVLISKISVVAQGPVPGLQSMAVSNEISGVQEQNIECASVQFHLSVHFKCAHKILNLYLKETLTKIVIIVVKNIPMQRLFCPVFRRKQFGPKI